MSARVTSTGRTFHNLAQDRVYLGFKGDAVAVLIIMMLIFGAFDVRKAFGFLGAADFDGRRFLHEIGTWLLIALLVVHILAAFLHQFVQKDGVLRRMLPGKGKSGVWRA